MVSRLVFNILCSGVYVAFLLTYKNVMTIKLFLSSLIWKLLVDFKAKNSHSLAIFPSTVRLREVILALCTSKLLYGRVLVEKLPEPRDGVRLREVSVSGGSTVSCLVPVRLFPRSLLFSPPGKEVDDVIVCFGDVSMTFRSEHVKELGRSANTITKRVRTEVRITEAFIGALF